MNYQSALANLGSYNAVIGTIYSSRLGLSIERNRKKEDNDTAERDHCFRTFKDFYELMLELDKPIPSEVNEDLMAVPTYMPAAGRLRLVTGIIKAFEKPEDRREWVKKLEIVYQVIMDTEVGKECSIEQINDGYRTLQELLDKIGPRLFRERDRSRMNLRGAISTNIPR